MAMDDTSQAGPVAGAGGPGFDLSLTQREQVLPAQTTREGMATGRAGLLMLPDTLRAELRIVRELPGGGEADVVLVEDAAARQWVVKIYRSNATVDGRAAARLTTLDRTFLVAPLRTGYDNGRHWQPAGERHRPQLDQRHVCRRRQGHRRRGGRPAGRVPAAPRQLGAAVGGTDVTGERSRLVVGRGLAIADVGLQRATARLQGLGHRVGIRAGRGGGVPQRPELRLNEAGQLIALLR